MGYVVRPVPRERQVVLDMLARAANRFPVHGLVELDVSEAHARIDASGGSVSWTGFVIATMARAVALHPQVNGRRAGSRLVLFDWVDVGATVERNVEGAVLLDAVTVRNADQKSCAEITRELHQAKESREPPTRPTGLMARVSRLPGPVRRGALRVAASRPRVAASFGPSIGVTSLGMFSRSGGWGIPVAPLTVLATVGGVLDRPVVREGRIVVRPMLPLTLTFDHAIVDGAPAARFVETLRDLTESAAALDQAESRSAGPTSTSVADDPPQPGGRDEERLGT